MAASRVSCPPQRVAYMDPDPPQPTNTQSTSTQPVQIGDVVTLEVEGLGK